MLNFSWILRRGFSFLFFFLFVVVVDNGTRDGLDKFLRAASTDPETVLHYEFMQDYKVLAIYSAICDNSNLLTYHDPLLFSSMLFCFN